MTGYNDPRIFWLAVLAFAIVVVTIRLALPRRGAASFAPRRVMTANELEFFWRLRAALPDYAVCPQVAMSALLTHAPRLKQGARLATRNRFDRKVVDFVVLDADGQTVALVELDDASHSSARDAARDAMTNAVGYRTVRFASRPRPTHDAIRSAVLK